jgi:glycosyltransferase involved in cell wall biosynthesis
MRIGINILYLRPSCVDGAYVYARRLLDSLALLDSENAYYVYLNRAAADFAMPAPNFQPVIYNFLPHQRLPRYLHEQVVLPLHALRHKLDLVHSLHLTHPLFLPCRSVMTLHDSRFMIPQLKGDIRGFRRQVIRFFAGNGARRATRVITDSEFAKRELIAHFGLRAEKIDVIYLSISPSNDAPSDSKAAMTICAQYGVQQPYIAAIGGSYEHKNVPRLLAAFAQIQDEFPHELVLIGKLPPDVTPELLSERVRALGYVPDAHLPILMHGADVFVVTSLYEGFGLPALEAQAADVALVCSKAASLPEVAGEGAYYFDPYDTADLAQALRTCLRDSTLRQTLRAKGRANLQRFSWQQTARQTLAVYQKVVKR